jgi:hypothetical protein
MNIFVLHEHPKIAAEMHCDKHCNKMIVEHAQMLSAAYYSTLGISRKKEIPDKQNEVNQLFKGWPRKNKDGSEWHYAISHVNHPCTVWTRSTIENFNWLLECTDHLCTEFRYRWKHEHSIKRIVDWMRENQPNLPSKGLTPFAQAMPDCFRSESAIEAYRKYYGMKTTYMKLEWRYSLVPEWWTEDLIQESVQTYEDFTRINKEKIAA